MIFGQSLIHYLTDPVLRGPTIGSMLMCFATGLIGVIVYLRKESLVGEALSHASYPGLALGALFTALVTQNFSGEWSIGLLLGAFFSSLLGLLTIYFLEYKMKISPDAALCFVLAAFFGIGVTIVSRLQFSHTALYRQSQLYLYGQAATMNDSHIILYGILVLLVLFLCFFFFKEILATTLDRDYAKTIGMNVRAVEGLVLILIVFAVVIGIRSVGVVLISAMLIAPAVTSRQLTDRLSMMFVFAGLMGLISGFLGNYFSNEFSSFLSSPGHRISLPTGPMIVLVAATFCFAALFFSPKRGWVFKKIRASQFFHESTLENLLKTAWRAGHPLSYQELTAHVSGSKFLLFRLVRRLKNEGWITKNDQKQYILTPEGQRRAAWIVRLHRLWEVYLVEYLGVGAERVHYSAEEMEHILTPELEEKLTRLLHDPKFDPHHSPIPKGDNP